MSEDDKILYNMTNSFCFLKIIGTVRFTQGNGLNTLIESAAGDTTITDFVIDLSETVYIDSTILGLLAKTARIAAQKKAQVPIIVSSNEDITLLLKNMGFEQFATIIPRYDMPADQLRRIEGPAEQDFRMILEAHQTLMNMNESNRNQFKDVVDLLKSEIHVGEQQS